MDALIVTGAVSLGGLAAFRMSGSATGDQIQCLGDKAFNSGSGCGAESSRIATPPLPSAQPASVNAPTGVQSAASGLGVVPGSGSGAEEGEPIVGASSGTSGSSGTSSAQGTQTGAGSGANPSLSDADLTVVTNTLKDQGGEAGKAHASPVVNLPSGLDPGLQQDGTNALLNAVAYATTKKPKYATQGGNILSGWTSNKDFQGRNGWLNAAWFVGSMAHSANILKNSGAGKVPGVKKQLDAFTDWAVNVANKELFPKDAPPFGTDLQKVLEWEKPLRPGPPQLGTKWERENVSNRTMAALEATMYVALLKGDMEWFDKSVQAYKYLVKPGKDNTHFFTDAGGTNTDQSRTDKPSWHHQAGIASAVAIAEMASHVTDPKTGKPYDLWSLENKILQKASEKYAGETLDIAKKAQKTRQRGGRPNADQSPSFIPWYGTALAHYGAKNMPNTAKALEMLNNDKGVGRLMNQGWGFNQFQ